MTLTSDDLESHIVVNVSLTLTNTTIWFVDALCFIVNIWTDGRTHRRTFLPGLLGHLSGDDLTKTEVERLISFQRSVSVKATVETNGWTDRRYQLLYFPG